MQLSGSDSVTLIVAIILVIVGVSIVGLSLFSHIHSYNPSSIANEKLRKAGKLETVNLNEAKTEGTFTSEGMSYFEVVNPVVGKVYTSKGEIFGCYRVSVEKINDNEFTIQLLARKNKNQFITAMVTNLILQNGEVSLTKHYVGKVIYTSAGSSKDIMIDMLVVYNRYPDGREVVLVQLIPLSH